MARELQRTLTPEEKTILTVQVSSKYGSGPIIVPYFCNGEVSRVPFSFCTTPIPSRAAATCKQLPFKGILRPSQVEVIKEVFSKLASNRAALIATHVGFGKTIMALYVVSQVKHKTVILVDLVELAAQWMEAIQKWLPTARACYLKAGYDKVCWNEYDIVVMNIVNVSKLKEDTYQVGLLIVDETHSMMTATLCPNLLYFTPQYLVGLSATPYRLDESHRLIEFFYGDTVVRRLLHKTHVVFRVNTGIEIPLESKQGRVNWNAVLSAQASSAARNTLIADIVNSRPELCFLILCKTVSQIMAIYQLLLARGVDSEAVFGNKRVVGEARVLIGTYKKLGKGFDRTKFNALLLAADIESYFVQALGRVFRDPNARPVVFDLVDRNVLLETHWRARRQVYLATGGSVHTVNGLNALEKLFPTHATSL